MEYNRRCPDFYHDGLLLFLSAVLRNLGWEPVSRWAPSSLAKEMKHDFVKSLKATSQEIKTRTWVFCIIMETLSQIMYYSLKSEDMRESNATQQKQNDQKPDINHKKK